MAFKATLRSVCLAVGYTLQLLVVAAGAWAMDKPVLSLVKKTAPPERHQFAGSTLELPAYEYGELTLNNIFAEPPELTFNRAIGADQCFVPIVRDRAGAVVSDGSNFGYARSPSLEQSKITIEPGASRTIKLGFFQETVPPEKRKPGLYHFRVQFHRGGQVWESNEIEISDK